MARAFIGLGSNEGDRLENLSDAAKRVGSVDGVRVIRMAPIIETEPVGGPEGQENYLNSVAEIESVLAPDRLLEKLQLIEQDLGRVYSEQRWAPRPIDLDILLYEDWIVDEATLSIPHPRLQDRLFVLVPLCQLDEGICHPIFKESVGSLLDKCLKKAQALPVTG